MFKDCCCLFISRQLEHLKKELKFLEEGRVHIDVRLSLFCLLYQLLCLSVVLINHRPVVWSERERERKREP